MSQTADGSVSAMKGSDRDDGALGTGLDITVIEATLSSRGYVARKPTLRSAHLTEIDVWTNGPDTHDLANALDGSGLTAFRSNRRSGHRFWMAMDATGWVKVDAKLRHGEPTGSIFKDIIWLGTRTRGLVVAVLGADGAGKSTAIDCVSRSMPIDITTKYLGIRRRPSPATATISSTELRPQSKPSWRSYAGFLRWAVQTAAMLWGLELAARKGTVVLCDRHPVEAGRLGNEPVIVKLAKRVFVRFATPAPDLLVLLQAPGEVLFARKGEHTPDYLNKMTNLWAELVATRDGLILDAARSPDDVCRELQSEIWQRLLPRRAE